MEHRGQTPAARSPPRPCPPAPAQVTGTARGAELQSGGGSVWLPPGFAVTRCGAARQPFAFGHGPLAGGRPVAALSGERTPRHVGVKPCEPARVQEPRTQLGCVVRGVSERGQRPPGCWGARRGCGLSRGFGELGLGAASALLCGRVGACPICTPGCCRVGKLRQVGWELLPWHPLRTGRVAEALRVPLEEFARNGQRAPLEMVLVVGAPPEASPWAAVPPPRKPHAGCGRTGGSGVLQPSGRILPRQHPSVFEGCLCPCGAGEGVSSPARAQQHAWCRVGDNPAAGPPPSCPHPPLGLRTSLLDVLFSSQGCGVCCWDGGSGVETAAVGCSPRHRVSNPPPPPPSRAGDAGGRLGGRQNLPAGAVQGRRFPRRQLHFHRWNRLQGKCPGVLRPRPGSSAAGAGSAR